MIPRQIDIGPLNIHLYGLIIGLAIFIGWYIAKKRAHLYKIHQSFFDDPILLVPLVISVISARIYHVLDYWQVYKADPVSIPFIQNGGLGIFGALIGAYIGFLIISKLKNIPIFKILDLASPSFILGQAIGRIGNFINQEGFGPPTNLPWKVYIEPQNTPINYLDANYFHPTFFYEAILDVIIFFILVSITKKFKKHGQIFATYLILYSTARFITEFWRMDTWTVGIIKIAHLLSIAAFALGLTILIRSKQKKS